MRGIRPAAAPVAYGTLRSTQQHLELDDPAKDIRPIESDVEYRKALRKIEAPMPDQAGTAAGDRLHSLITLVGLYE